ncbi:hypothetical protein GGR16_003254 [Chelatococcus caeni]|uniref:Uncharacterized protein n=1 Tax=Chelatococcus caeni TaxID=1348468 RepID=A0A840BZ38_9HYPH|nr:hypothetical protein [Chelatococcus caeni]MBB4018220.1 hypothetical protein [Chelatococcus caeni]
MQLRGPDALLLDRVPAEGHGDALWALGELSERRRTSADILFELNDRLAAKGIAPVLRSTFNRVAIRRSIREA